MVDSILKLKNKNKYSLFEEIKLGTHGEAKIYIKSETPHQFSSKLELKRDGTTKSWEFEYAFINSVHAYEIRDSIFYFVTLGTCGASSCSSKINVYH